MTRPLSQGTRLVLASVVLLFLCTFLTYSPGQASTPPSFDRLSPISAQVQSPTGLALDQQGRIYIAETTVDRVAIFSQSGSFLHAIIDQQGPISVTVGPDGRIYIGNKDSGNVSVYSSTFSFLFKLGQGDGEFGFPAAIAVDSTTNSVLVADRDNSSVRKYNPDGSFSVSIGQPGNGDGQFHKPVSLAIDSNGAELIVIDQQQRNDTFYGTMINGARIQYFDLNGTFLRGYSKFGYNIDAGELSKPVHVVVDNTSRIYVTDASRQKVLVYDNTDTFLGLVNDTAHPFRTPLGLTIGATNRLYVSSYFANQVEVFGLDEYAAMDVAPHALSFQAIEGGANPTPKSTTIHNTGRTPLSWTASSQDSRLNLTGTSGSLPISGSLNLGINMDSQGLAPGMYTSSVAISIAGARETVNIALTVIENPLQVSPNALVFNAEKGTASAGQTISVATNSLTPVNWSASADRGWLSISRAEGTTPESIQVTVATENLSAGTYSGTITVSNQQGDPAPVTVAVTLHLTDPGDTPIEPPDPPPPGQDDDNRKWTVTQILPGISLNGVWGSSNDVYVVGAAGTILQKNGKKWLAMDSGSSNTLHSVWGSSEDDIYAVGDSGLVLHYDGKDWAPVAAVTEETLHDVIGTDTDVLAVDDAGSILSDSLTDSTPSGVALRSIWGSSDTDIFVTGAAGTILHFDGTGWESMDSDTDRLLHAVWGSSASDVFGVGEDGVIVHYDGTVWSAMDSGTDETLLSVWGGSDTDVFAVGESGLILHYNGTGWFPVTSGAAVTLNDIWVSAKSRVYAVGGDGIIISGKSRFPLLHFFTNSILVNAAQNNDDEDKKTVKGPMPAKITQGK